MQSVSLPEVNKIETRIAALWEQEVVIVNARCTRKYSALLTTSTWFTQEVEHQGPFGSNSPMALMRSCLWVDYSQLFGAFGNAHPEPATRAASGLHCRKRPKA